MAGAFFFLRLNDHVQYLRKIQATLEGKDDFQGTCHNSCKLGKWINSTGPQEAAEAGSEASEVFRSLITPHERFHHASHQALEKKLAGDHAAAELYVTEMHQLSNTLVRKLIALDKLASESNVKKKRLEEAC